MLLLCGGISQEEFFESLGSDVVWLMIGAFILGSAVKHAGLAFNLEAPIAFSRKTEVRADIDSPDFPRSTMIIIYNH
ncbi:hypothetical protein [Nostoc paludosum]|nr:hypothetical protein [Nostoc paludosum]